MTKPFVRSAVLLCCVMAATHAQSATYELVSRVVGSTDWVLLDSLPGFANLPWVHGDTTFDVTTRALVEYSGSGSLQQNETNAEMSISVRGEPALTSTVRGSLFISTGRVGPDIHIYQSFMGGDDWKFFSLDQTFKTYAQPGADYTSLPSSVPFGATTGYLDYTIYVDHQQVIVGDMEGTIESASFTLTPVPEPTTWAMLVAGMLVTGSVLRRRRIWESPGDHGITHNPR